MPPRNAARVTTSRRLLGFYLIQQAHLVAVADRSAGDRGGQFVRSVKLNRLRGCRSDRRAAHESARQPPRLI